MQPIYNIAEICAQHGVKQAILSPGSRCAPLSISFARHPEIECKVIPDERSAAFIAMGIAQQTKNPVVLICTSGSAALNYYPAIAEAFYQNIPLLILTADRPAEWINQQDGQTIQQNQVYGKHCKAAYTFPADYSHPDAVWQTERIVSEAIINSLQFPKGPVHINIPLREPLYPTGPVSFSKEIKVIQQISNKRSLEKATIQALEGKLRACSRIMLIAGQQDPQNVEFTSNLSSFINRFGAIVITEPISNIADIKHKIASQDLIVADFTPEETLAYQPDLIISFGGAVISKSLKGFLRKYKAKEHWHINPGGEIADTFQSITNLIQLTPEEFFSSFSPATETNSAYQNTWNSKENKYRKLKDNFFQNNQNWAEIQAVQRILASLPDQSILHVSNSMPIRYVNFISINNPTIQLFCNRGTSGIDGVISTAYGAALATDQLVTVITGDMAFFYDRNAFWNNYLPKNLRIILINNHGGGIFRMIEGPSSQPEVEEYFATTQKLEAKNLASEYNIHYLAVHEQKTLSESLKDFFSPDEKPKILEIFTNPVVDKQELKNFKKIGKEN